VSDGQRDMREVLKRVAVALKQSDVAFALGGGYAGWALGGPEPEHDVDFLVAQDDVSEAAKALTDAGLRVDDPPEDWLFKVFDGEAMVDLIFIANNTPVDAALLARSEQVEVCSVLMPVLSATELIITKMLALQETSCDYGKVLPLARALREQIDWQEVRRRTGGNVYSLGLLLVLERLEISPAQP
jgi:hypothetical protein